MSAIPIKLSDDWLDYSAEWILHEPVLQRHGIVSKSKNTFNQIMNKPSMNQFLEIKEKIGKFFGSMKRMAYIPLIAGALALTPEQAKAQCCGIDYITIGWWVGYESTRDDYYANKNNGRTKDGIWYNAKLMGQMGHFRFQVVWATAKHEKYQDADNRYKAYFPRLWGGIWYSPSDPEARIVVYGTLDAWWIWTIMKWSREFPGSRRKWWSTDFKYSQINTFFGGTLWLQVNVDERFMLDFSADALTVLNGKLDNIKGGAVTPDIKWGVHVGIYFILY